MLHRQMKRKVRFEKRGISPLAQGPSESYASELVTYSQYLLPQNNPPTFCDGEGMKAKDEPQMTKVEIVPFP